MFVHGSGPAPFGELLNSTPRVDLGEFIGSCSGAHGVGIGDFIPYQDALVAEQGYEFLRGGIGFQ